MNEYKIFKISVIADKEESIEFFAQNVLHETLNGYRNTTGYDFLVKTITINEHKIARLQFWLLSTKQMVKSLRSSHLRGSLGIILIFDTTDNKSLELISEEIALVRNVIPGRPIVLVGIKPDLRANQEILEEQLEAFKENQNISDSISLVSEEDIKNMYKILMKQIMPDEFDENFFSLEPIRITKHDLKGKTDRKSAKLRVERLEKSRSGRSLCYIDQDEMIKLGLNTGDIIEIRGKKKTTGIAVSSSPDRGKGIIRLDGLQRLNAGATIGEFVSIKSTDVYPAIEIVLTPTRPNIDLKRQTDAIKSKIIDKPLVIGDIVDVYGTFVQRGDNDDPMSDLMKMFQLVPRKRATLGTLRLIVDDLKPSDKIVKVTRDTLIKVNKRVVVLNKVGEKVTYSHIGGLSDEILKIREIVELPLKHPELFQKLRITPLQGILLYGPSGVGKTLLVKAISQETGLNFISVSGAEIYGKFSGESEGKLREIFRNAEENAPSILFFDKIDVIAPKEEFHTDKLDRRVIAQLLTLMDGLRGRCEVIIIAETNRIDDINPALRRPGRFDREIEIKPPDTKGRLEILRIHTREMPLDEDVDLQLIAERTQGFVGADLEALVKEAAILEMKEVLPKIKEDISNLDDALDVLQIRMKHFLTALESMRPSTLRQK
ncbi:MAG: AAA family ATPase [Promethearchaeota archaeon]